jgi:hypothetical protein
VVTDRGGTRREGVDSGDVAEYRACGVCTDALDVGDVGDVGEGPGNGEECTREELIG